MSSSKVSPNSSYLKSLFVPETPFPGTAHMYSRLSQGTFAVVPPIDCPSFFGDTCKGRVRIVDEELSVSRNVQ